MSMRHVDAARRSASANDESPEGERASFDAVAAKERIEELERQLATAKRSRNHADKRSDSERLPYSTGLVERHEKLK